MSEGRKRSRKAKLVVRTDDDVDETANTILQKIPSVGKPEAKTVDHTNPIHVSEPSSAFQLSVNVEVEELDESTMNEDTNDSTSVQPKRFNVMYSKNIDAVMIRVSQINHDHMFKISNNITCSSKNPADQYFGVEIRNMWGRILTCEEEIDPHDVLIQKALRMWGVGLEHGRLTRESPIFYQCLKCKIAWWRLDPFRSHIRMHDPKELKVHYQDNNSESIIVANNSFNKVTLIECEGNCYRCGNNFTSHVKGKENCYKCQACNDRFLTCGELRRHVDSICSKQPTTHNNWHFCNFCGYRFTTQNEREEHMETAHLVRSDDPSPSSVKFCTTCRMRYHYFQTHMCKKKPMNIACMYCYRKFPTRMLADIHILTGEVDFECNICNVKLMKKCMLTEHMLTHTEKYQKAFRCTSIDCSPTLMFQDEMSVRIHKALYHKQKFDRRKTYCDLVVVPKECMSNELPQNIDDSDVQESTPNFEAVIPKIEVLDKMADEEIKKRTDKYASKGKDKNIKLAVVPQKCMSSDSTQHVSDSDVQKSTASKRKNLRAVIPKIKKVEKKANKKIEIQTAKKAPQKYKNIELEMESLQKDDDDNDEDFSEFYEDIDYDQMDYEQMLAKVFKVSDSVKNAKPYLNSDEVDRTQIKIEPVDDRDFENLIDMQVNPITIKEEPIEMEQMEFTMEQNEMDDTCLEDGTTNIESSFYIKTEPQDLEIDSMYEQDISAVKIEPELKIELVEPNEVTNISCDPSCTEISVDPINIKKELLEAMDIRIMGTYSEQSLLAQMESEAKPVKKVRRKQIQVFNSKSLLKKNYISESELTLNTPNTEQKNQPDSNQNEERKKSKPNGLRPIRHLDSKGIRKRRMYTCRKCGYTNKHKLYRIHCNSLCTHSVTDTTKFTCTKCCISFGSMKMYITHFETHGYRARQCPVCNVKFETLDLLLSHFPKHVKQSFVNCWVIDTKSDSSTNKQHRCQECRLVIPPECSFAHWENHLTLKPEGEIEPEEEPNPKVECKGNKLLPTMVLNDAIDQLRSLATEQTCQVCGRYFSRRQDCKRHLIEHLLLDARTKKCAVPDSDYRCQICRAEFPRPDYYKFHMREHGSLPVYRCELCNKTFSDSSNFAKHKKVHSSKVLICDLCKKKFHAKSSLIKHMLMHQVTAPTICEHCNKLFYTPSQYKKHLKSLRQKYQTDSNRYRCPLCDEAFCSLRDKWEHAWNEHQERKQKADCPVCFKGFRRFIDVKRHARDEHHVDLSYKCRMKRVKSQDVEKRITIVTPVNYPKTKTSKTVPATTEHIIIAT